LVLSKQRLRHSSYVTTWAFCVVSFKPVLKHQTQMWLVFPKVKGLSLLGCDSLAVGWRCSKHSNPWAGWWGCGGDRLVQASATILRTCTLLKPVTGCVRRCFHWPLLVSVYEQSLTFVLYK